MQDRRKETRVPKLLKALFAYEGKEYNVVITDISKTGAFIHYNLLPPEGTMIDFSFNYKEDPSSPVIITGMVERHSDPARGTGTIRGFGVSWKKAYSPGGKEVILNFLSSVFGKTTSAISGYQEHAEKPNIMYHFKEDAISEREVTRPEFKIPQMQPPAQDKTDAEMIFEDAIHVSIPCTVLIKQHSFKGKVSRVGAKYLSVHLTDELPDTGTHITVRLPVTKHPPFRFVQIFGKVISTYPSVAGGEMDVKISIIDEMGNPGSFRNLLKSYM